MDGRWIQKIIAGRINADQDKGFAFNLNVKFTGVNLSVVAFKDAIQHRISFCYINQVVASASKGGWEDQGDEAKLAIIEAICNI